MHTLVTIGDAPSGVIPIGDNRFATGDISLSSALCPLGFFLKIKSQPVAVTIDADNNRRIVTFFHEHSNEIRTFTAPDVDTWWNGKPGQYTLPGYDDALTAMKRVGVERKRMIDLAKHGPKYKTSRNTVVGTSSLHSAAILAACEIKLIGYDPSGRQWIFAKGAEVISDLIKAGGKPKERPLSNDLCIDWMLEWLRYHDWLKQLVKDPENIPLMTIRDGERVLQISRDMPDKLRREWETYI